MQRKLLLETAKNLWLTKAPQSPEISLHKLLTAAKQFFTAFNSNAEKTRQDQKKSQ
jgi:hypothetical protein